MSKEPENPPTLQEPIDFPAQEINEITIPVLSESVNQGELEYMVFNSPNLSPTFHRQLSEQITLLLEQKINDILPAIMQEAEQRISLALRAQITEQLPSIINEALKTSRN